MQKCRETRWRPLQWLSMATIMLLVALLFYEVVIIASIASTALLYYDPTVPRGHGLAVTSASGNTVATNGASRWIGDRRVTGPAFDFSPPATQRVSVAPLFEGYYTSYSGPTSLGTPLTVAFPTAHGWLQFFDRGALLLPAAQRQQGNNTPPTLSKAAHAKDGGSEVIRLPLLQALLTAGSNVPLDGDVSSLTYIDLREATNPTFMLPAPSAARNGKQDIFIKGGTRDGKEVGHLIPRAFWTYMHRPDISPDGWRTDFGPPLTEALPCIITQDGSLHHVLVQAFSHDGLVLDQTAPDTQGQPQIQPLQTGIAYLRTIGPPAAEPGPHQPIWSQGETTLLDAAGTGQPVAHVGRNFPLTLLGDTSWNSGTLWYHVRWETPEHTASAWVPAAIVTFSSPGNVPGWASVDALSPPLAAYLATTAGNVATVMYDVTRQRYYTYHANARFITGSSMKVPIMLAFLALTEQQGREPNADEMDELTTMIENSDNDAASALYYGELGGAGGVESYVQRIGVSGLNPDPDAWGDSLITPQAMVKMLSLLHAGKILTSQDNSLALTLMEHVEADQQVGVGDSAPQGASVAMKNGWRPGPDGLWAMNSSGIVTLGRETYIIAVYTQEQNSLDAGQSIVRHVCDSAASLLT